MAKRIMALTVLLFCAALALLGCGGTAQKHKNAEKYGSPIEFAGEADEVRVMFVNVGKADCAIVCVGGSAWLVDTGTEASFVKTCAALAYMGVERLAGVILSHGHDDHIGGLYNLLQRYPTETVYYPEFLADAASVAEAVTEAGAQGAAVKAGDLIPVTAETGFRVLAPEKQLPIDDNDNSMVVKITLNGRKFLFTGDMQTAEEKVLLESGADLTCDVLKVGNHGNRDATSAEFAKAVSPLIAVISTDRAVDSNSASALVKSRLSMADIFTTQDTELGVMLFVSKRGEISVSYPEKPAPTGAGVILTAADKAGQFFTVKNGGDSEADISNWFVYSTKGYEVFFFPQGTVLAPGAELTVACQNSPAADSADIVWKEKKVWSDTKEDIAVLCGANGCEIMRLRSE